MRTDEFDFHLPEELIAQYPPKKRGTSRLMVLERKTGKIFHSSMKEITEWIKPQSLLVFNDTKVRKARIYGEKKNKPGKQIEFLLVNKISPNRWKAIARRAKRQRIGDYYTFPEGVEAKIVDEEENLKILDFSLPIDDNYLERNGHVPLPPYIKRSDLPDDERRYQTVFAREYGAVAAPTAGLHFTWELLNKLKTEVKADIAYITLHVGIGTFAPIRVDEIEKHKMHSEEFTITEDSATKIEKAYREQRDIIAVGTTVIRTLESAWQPETKTLKRGDFTTNLFIYPGYRFKIVNKIFTNFHTPRSSLLLLISAFVGKEKLLNAYKIAIEKGYRFFSYGDAMLIL